MQAVLCPVCNGSGKCYHPAPRESSACGSEETCHGCGGKGWVEIGLCGIPGPFYPYSPPFYTVTSYEISGDPASAGLP